MTDSWRHGCQQQKVSRSAGARASHVVGNKAIATALREDGGGDDEVAALAVSRGPHELFPAIAGRSVSLVAESVDNLGELPAHKVVLLVAVAVILDQNLSGVFVAFLADQPSGALGHKPDGEEQCPGHKALEAKWKTPLDFPSQVLDCSKACPCRDDSLRSISL